MSRIIMIVIGFVGLTAAAVWLCPPSYRIETGPAQKIENRDLSRLDNISSSDVRKILPVSAEGVSEVAEMSSSRYFDYMAMNSLLSLHSALQGRENPVVIEIKSGVRHLEDLEDGEHIVRQNGRWIIKVPIIIQSSGTLIIDVKDTVILDGESGSFLSSFGKLFIVDSTVRSSGTLSWHKKKFRPFIVIWSGAEGYFADSRFYDLGYDHAKSYGVTFSSSAIMERDLGEKPAPKGMLIGNHFEGLYYGFYSYEAEDIVIAHNVYKDNIVYGIDPHDYSRRLKIVGNDVSGTKEKHGIILSRGVTDSIVYSNKSYQNAGSGIMLERSCTENVIVDNEIRDNKGDGLVFLESSHNVSQNNKMKINGRSGIRIRNSRDLTFYKDESSGNKDYGLFAYSRALIEQKERDLSKDSYSRSVDFSMADARLLDNKKAAINIKDVQQAAFSHVVMLKSPKIAAGDLEPYGADIADAESLILTREKSYADFLLMR